jgi:hypothetical protein
VLADAEAPGLAVLSGKPDARHGLPETVLVRPDGYVAWTSAAAGDMKGVSAALRSWFPGPAAARPLRHAG